MPVRSDRSFLGPHWQIVRWKLGQLGFACFPHSDENRDGKIAILDDGTRTTARRYLRGSRTSAKFLPTTARGLPIRYGNRYWHDGAKESLSWWGSASKYVAEMNYRSPRWTLAMTPDEPGAPYNIQPTRYAELFFGDYYWRTSPPSYPVEGPYQIINVRADGNNGVQVGRPLDPALFYRSERIATAFQGDAITGIEYEQWAGAGITETKSGRWVIAVTQPNTDIITERVVAMRPDGSEKHNIFSMSWDIDTEDPLWLEQFGFFFNWEPWNFSPDGARACAIRWRFQRNPDAINALDSIPELWELVIGQQANGSPTAYVRQVDYRPAADGDYYVTWRGIKRVGDDGVDIGTYGNGYGFGGEDLPLMGLDYDSGGVLRQIYVESYIGSFYGGSGPNAVDERGIRSDSMTIQHVDCRDEILLARMRCEDGQRYVLWWGDDLVWSEVFHPLDADIGATIDPREGAGVVVRPDLNATAAASADGQFLAVSTMLIRDLATIMWRPDTGYTHNGEWWTQRKFHSAVYRRDPQTGEITTLLDNADMADAAGLPGETLVRLFPVVPI